MSKFSLVIIVGIITMVLGTYFFIAPEWSNRPGIFPQEGISVLHSDNIDVSNLVFDLYVTDNPQKLFIDFDLLFKNKTKPGFVAFVIPYPGRLTNFDHPNDVKYMHCWTSSPHAGAEQILISRNFPCEMADEIEHYKNNTSHLIWQFEIYGEVDSIRSFTHKSQLKFFPEPNNPEIIKSIDKKFSDNLLDTWLEDEHPQLAKITISEFFTERSPIPETESNPYHNRNDEITNDISYTWEITENNSVFTVDFSSNTQLWQVELKPLLAPVLFSTGISFLIMGLGHYLTIEHNQNKARQALNRDFNRIRSTLVAVISDLRIVLLSLNPNTGVVDDLVSGRNTPYKVMLPFVRGIFFRSWDVNLHRISDLDSNESDTLSQLHEYIVQSNNIEELSIYPVVEQLGGVLNNTTLIEPQRRDMLLEILRRTIMRRLQTYDTIYHRLHNELQTIEWITLPSENHQIR